MSESATTKLKLSLRIGLQACKSVQVSERVGANKIKLNKIKYCTKINEIIECLNCGSETEK